MVAVRVSVRHRESSEGNLDTWAAALAAPEDAVRAVGEVVEAHVAERIASRTSPWGDAWAPQSPATIEINRRRGRRDDSLSRTRFVQVLDGGKRVVVGFTARFARAFHGGAPNNKAFGRGSAPIPARPVLPLRGRTHDLPPTLREEVKAAFVAGMRRALRGAR